MVRVKICGITNLDDALLAVTAGADALGFVFYEQSPRYLPPARAAAIIAQLPPFIQTVGLFVDAEPDQVNWTANFCGLDLIQLHGNEPPDYYVDIERRLLKAFRIRDAASLEPLGRYAVAGYLLDAWVPGVPGGTGQTFNWELALAAKKFGPIILAGGLTPDNVRQAVAQVQPYAVDVSSGVEAAPGRKDAVRVREFIKQAKGL
jgi:phosphoribosylanthranilate isomerase